MANKPAPTQNGFDASGYEVEKVVTLPIIKKLDGVTIGVKVTGPIYLGRELKAKTGEAKKQPANLMPVIDLSTGEAALIVCNTVLKSNLEETYPDQSYVGKLFSITQIAARQGVDYKTFTIKELKDKK